MYYRWTMAAATVAALAGCGGSVLDGGVPQASPAQDGGATAIATVDSSASSSPLPEASNGVDGTRSSGNEAGGGGCEVPPDAGAVITVLASCLDTPGSIVVDASNVYWASAGGLMRAPIAGGQPVTLAAGPTYGVAVDAQNVYWTESTTNVGVVVATPLAGGSALSLARNQDAPTDIVVLGSNVYWTNTAGNAVMVAPIAHDAPPRALWSAADSTLPTTIVGPHGICTDGANVYWAAKSYSDGQ